jgi:hypothetical protein
MRTFAMLNASPARSPNPPRRPAPRCLCARAPNPRGMHHPCRQAHRRGKSLYQRHLGKVVSPFTPGVLGGCTDTSESSGALRARERRSRSHARSQCRRWSSAGWGLFPTGTVVLIFRRPKGSPNRSLPSSARDSAVSLTASLRLPSLSLTNHCVPMRSPAPSRLGLRPRRSWHTRRFPKLRISMATATCGCECNHSGFAGLFQHGGSARSSVGFGGESRRALRPTGRFEVETLNSAGRRVKSRMAFCPMSCGCIRDPSLPGCPLACKYHDSPMPQCRDLS